MLSRLQKIEIAGLLLACTSLLPTAAMAQITPDATLGTESSRVRPGAALRRGGTADLIEGGATRGANLFHSFSEFNVNDGQRVYFANPDGIANILSRVTGTDVSDIRGTLGVDGSANLFFLNPNGINFGPDARLDVLGSFLATTGNDFLFPDGSSFGTSNPQAPSLLTVSVPVGVQYGGRVPGAIGVTSRRQTGLDMRGNPAYEGLSVPAGRNLSLLGGEVIVNGGVLSAPGGRIELLGIKGQGTVSFDPTNRFPNAQTENLGTVDISVLNASEISSSVKTGVAGDIEIDGDPISISNSSIRADGFNDQTSGDFPIISIGPFTENLTIRGSELSARNFNSESNESGAGFAGNIEIRAYEILIQNSKIRTDGFAGQIIVSSESVSPTLVRIINSTFTNQDLFDGERVEDFFGSVDITSTNGSVEIRRSNFDASAYIDPNNLNSNDSGDIRINASERIRVHRSRLTSNGRVGAIYLGVNAPNSTGPEVIPSRVIVSRSTLSTSNSNTEVAGDIGITAVEQASIHRSELSANGSLGRIIIGEFVEQDGDVIVPSSPQNIVVRNSGLFTSNLSSSDDLRSPTVGNSGNIDLDAENRIELSDSILASSTYGLYSAGNISLLAENEILLSSTNLFGTVEEGRAHKPTDQGGDFLLQARSISLLNGSQLQSLVRRQQRGNSGSIRISSDTLRLEGFNEQGNPSAISNLNDAEAGNAGNIIILTDTLRLSNQAVISTNSRSTAGGIALQSELLLMQDNGEILAKAAGNGGVLLIESGLIVAPPNQDSNISASAIFGQGGIIKIDSQELFGIREGIRNPESQNNVIDASSVEGSSGVVEINTPNLDPAQGLVELPTRVVDASQQLAQTCPADAKPEEQGSFVRTGRSGLPATPTDPLGTQEIAAEWYTPTEVAANNVAASLPADPPEQIIEAQGWVKHSDGSVEMVAAGPANSPVPTFESVSCHE